MTNPWQEYKKKLGTARPWHLIDKENYTEEDVAKKRMDICEQCDRLIQTTKQCKECGCFMNLKTKLKQATCPLNKW